MVSLLLLASLLAQDRIESLLDKPRNRTIPLAIYTSTPPPTKAAIISHGYGNRNTSYTFLARYLAAQGYYVVSIQHELPGDPPLPSSGPPFIVRMPAWKRGAENILFTLNHLKSTRPELDYSQVLLLGHSQGGDISALFVRDHPGLVSTLVTLDNRRMTLPRDKTTRILSLRSSDQPADNGVLPTTSESKQFPIRIIQMPKIIHNDMCDVATPTQQAEILTHLAEFLNTR